MRLTSCIFAMTLGACTFAGDLCLADAAQTRSATIRGKSEVVVTKSKIVLSDLAEISADNAEAQLALSKIELGTSPKPGATIELNAEKVIERLQAEGVDLKRVGYIFSPHIKVRRASRTLSEPEVEAAIQAAIGQDQQEVVLNKIQLPRDAQVFTGPITIQASLASSAVAGQQRPYRLALTSQEGEQMTLEGRASIDAWKEVPVAARSLSPGSILEAVDFGLARLNIKDLPKDFAGSAQELIGKQLQREIGVGQVFRVNSLERPAVIKSGARVTLLFHSGALEASATGVALQDGHDGDMIEVRNETSRRIVHGQIKDQNTIEVLQ